MTNIAALRAGRIVTVGRAKTIRDGVVVVKDGLIDAVGTAADFGSALDGLPMESYPDKVLSPGLIDCHSHLFEYAAATVHPVTAATHTASVEALLLHALSCGITSIGDHICGFPGYSIDAESVLASAKRACIRTRAALCTISLGSEPPFNLSALTGNAPIAREQFFDAILLDKLIALSTFPGENVFITATPGNLPLSQMPNSGKLMYSLSELRSVADAYHAAGKRLGAHVGGEAGIDLALNAGIDVLHHAHGMSEKQMARAKKAGVPVVDTPLGGTHLPPRPPENVETLVDSGLIVSIATDAYLPAPKGMTGLVPDKLYGPEALMAIAAPSLRLMHAHGRDENDCLALLTKNPAAVLGLAGKIGEITPGACADLVVADGVPALELTDTSGVRAVYCAGVRVIAR